MSVGVHTETNKISKIILETIVWGVIPASVAALALFMEQNLILLLFVLPALAAVIFRFPYTALVIVAVSGMFVESLHSTLQIVPRQVTWVSDIAIILLAARVFAFSKFKLMDARDPFRVPLLLFSAIFLCSALLNSVRPAVILVSFRQYFKYIILYLAITSLPIPLRDVSRSLKLFFHLILLQVPIIIICFFLGLREDRLSGGLGNVGGTAPLALLSIAGANVFLSDYIHRGKCLDLLKFIALSMVPAISELKFSILILPISVMATMLLPMFRYRKRILAVLIVLSLLMPCVIMTYTSIYPSSLQNLISWSHWMDYLTVQYERRERAPGHFYLGRLTRVRVAASYVTKDFPTALFGTGPGETSDSFFEAGKGSLYATILGDVSGVQFALVLLELGILGLLLSTWIMVQLPRGLAKLYKATTIDTDKALICGLFGTSLMFMPFVFYLSVIFTSDTTSFLFWVSAAYLSLSVRKIKC